MVQGNLGLVKKTKRTKDQGSKLAALSLKGGWVIKERCSGTQSNILSLLVSSERVHNNCELPVGITIFVNAWFG